METLRLVVFPGGFNWPVWVAEALGYFRNAGVAVEVTPTPGSVFQLSGLIEGRFDLAITLVDNVIAYRSGQGEAPVVGEDLCALMAADTRVLPTLVTQPHIRRYSDLRAQTLSVDALTTGYAFVLLAMLEHGGLGRRDYRLDSIGGAQQRYHAMRDGLHAGCLLNSPFERLLEAEGFNLLDNAGDVLGRYQGQVLAARHGWAVEHRDAVSGFIRAFLDAVAWLYDPAHRARAFEIFRQNVAGADDAAAATAHAVLFDEERGFPRDGAIDPQALAKVIELRSRYGVPARELRGPEEYFDPGFLAQARADGG